MVTIRGAEYVLYANASSGTSRITLAHKETGWDTQLLQNVEPRPDDQKDALFPHAVAFKNSLFVFWENGSTNGTVSALVQLPPLTSVAAPVSEAGGLRAR